MMRTAEGYVAGWHSHDRKRDGQVLLETMGPRKTYCLQEKAIG